jgi:hypothetical protein
MSFHFAYDGFYALSLRKHNSAKAFRLKLVNAAMTAPNIVLGYFPRQPDTNPRNSARTTYAKENEKPNYTIRWPIG